MSSKNVQNLYTKDELESESVLRDDSIDYYLYYRGKIYYFDLPMLYDKSFLLREIKSRTGVKHSFSIRFTEKKNRDVKTKNKKIQTKDQNQNPKEFGKKSSKQKTSHLCIHSTNLSTIALAPFRGETLYIVDNDSRKYY